MIIVQPSAELEAVTPKALELIEKAGRTCWKSEDKIEEGSAEKFIRGTLMKKQHYSVLEHAVATFRFICDRGVTHEMVRHRIASFSQESTRYCNYGKEKFGGGIQVILPPFIHPNISNGIWDTAMQAAELAYLTLLEVGEPPQLARAVLPTCLKTEIVLTANFREWLHIFDLRSVAPPAHPQIAEVMLIAQKVMQELYPCIFVPVPEVELEPIPVGLVPGEQVFSLPELYYLRALLAGNGAQAGVTKEVVESVRKKLAA